MKHDPYWDIPLKESLPQPVVGLPELPKAGEDDRFKLGAASGKRRRKGRGRNYSPGWDLVADQFSRAAPTMLLQLSVPLRKLSRVREDTGHGPKRESAILEIE
jgi:hypothetical protein